jgi:hypothetical protein
MQQRPSPRPDSRTEPIDPEEVRRDLAATASEATHGLKLAVAGSLERRNRARETLAEDDERVAAPTTEGGRDVELRLADLREEVRRLEKALTELTARRRRGKGVVKPRQVVPLRPVRRTAPRTRGAGRPATRRTVTRSSAASGDSGDPDPSSPPSRAGTVARPRRAQGASRNSEEMVA